VYVPSASPQTSAVLMHKLDVLFMGSSGLGQAHLRE